jgi:hypothetical protein
MKKRNVEEEKEGGKVEEKEGRRRKNADWGWGGVGVEGGRQESEVSHYNAKDYSRPRERNSSYQLLTDPASYWQIPPATNISWQFLPAPNRYWQLLEYPSIYWQTLKVSTSSWLFF